MKKIKFTNGTLSRLGEYYELTLFNNGKQVYIGTLDKVEASNLMNKSNKIIFA
jgi:hypothetical protein